MIKKSQVAELSGGRVKWFFLIFLTTQVAELSGWSL